MASEAGVDWLLGERAFMRSDGVEMTMSSSLSLDCYHCQALRLRGYEIPGKHELSLRHRPCRNNRSLCLYGPVGLVQIDWISSVKEPGCLSASMRPMDLIRAESSRGSPGRGRPRKEALKELSLTSMSCHFSAEVESGA
jgi:hypothetical protein